MDKWTSYDGRKLGVKDFDDLHLNNVVWLMKERCYMFFRSFGGIDSAANKYLSSLLAEAEHRGFNPEVFGSKQMPFKKEGKWYYYVNGAVIETYPPASDMIERYLVEITNGKNQK